MREIKFRAWNEKEKYMYGNIQHLSFGAMLIDDDFEIMQFTGLTDKNGKEIYEGDIVKSRVGLRILTGVMYFNEEKAQFGFEAAIDSMRDVPEHIELFSKPDVIGNIYENPELLKR